MIKNIEYSYDWITEEIIKTHFKEKETGVKEVVTISKLDLLKFMQKFIKTIERGGN